MVVIDISDLESMSRVKIVLETYTLAVSQCYNRPITWLNTDTFGTVAKPDPKHK